MKRYYTRRLYTGPADRALAHRIVESEAGRLLRHYAYEREIAGCIVADGAIILSPLARLPHPSLLKEAATLPQLAALLNDRPTPSPTDSALPLHLYQVTGADLATGELTQGWRICAIE